MSVPNAVTLVRRYFAPPSGFTESFEDKAAEETFRREHLDYSLWIIRLGLVLAWSLHSVYVLLELSLDSPQPYPAVLTLAAGTVLLLVALPLTRNRFVRRHFQNLNTLAVIVIAGLILALLHYYAVHANGGGRHGVAGLVLFIMWLYTMSGLTQVRSACLGWGIAAAYTADIFVLTDTAAQLALNNLFFVAAANVVGMIACYSIETFARAAFLNTRRLQGLATTDALTELPNRRHILELVHRETERARRLGRPLTIMMIDIDRFKGVNDRHGHIVGDCMLRAIAQRLRANLRAADLIGRYGGEEFLSILPDTDPPTAARLAARLLDRVRDHRMTCDNRNIRITISIGAAFYDGGAGDTEALIQRADRALYDAKHNGRDCYMAR